MLQSKLKWELPCTAHCRPQVPAEEIKSLNMSRMNLAIGENRIRLLE